MTAPGPERPADDARPDAGTLPDSDLADRTPPAAQAGGQDPAMVGSPQPQVVEGSAETLPGSPPSDSSLTGAASSKRGDRVFFGLSVGASGGVVVIVLLIAAFLLSQSIPSIVHDKANFLTSYDWSTTPGHLRYGIARLLWATVLISLLALVIAVPLGIGIALFTTQYAPRRLARPTAHVIDLLAAIPSIIYGVWGARVLAPELTPVQDWLTHLNFIPLFNAGYTTGTIFDGGVVLAVMILPIITAISRDVFERTPSANIEAALALGATKWEVIRTAVLPYGRPGVISGTMLGLGRALGETIAVYLIVSTTSSTSNSLFNGGETFASKIANNAAEFGLHPGPYIAAGLVLFVLTFVVNAIARYIVSRRKDFV